MPNALNPTALNRTEVTVVADRGLATILPRKATTAAQIGAALGLVLDSGPVLSQGANGLGLLGTGPRQWLAQVASGAAGIADLAGALTGLADVVDQSGSQILFALSGPGARSLLQSGLAIDLDPVALRQERVIASVIAHINVIVWQEAGRWIVAVPRSFAGSFRRWLALSGVPA